MPRSAASFDARRGTFTQFYGSQGLDAALLKIPRLGFLPPHDPRVVSTVRAIGEELSADGLILRYDPSLDASFEANSEATSDGLPGTEGSFLACSFWMVEALCATGSVREATTLFERLLSLRNDVGLLSEEYDVRDRRLLGNTPQAFSHVGLINAARTLTDAGATRRTASHGPTVRGPDDSTGRAER